MKNLGNSKCTLLLILLSIIINYYSREGVDFIYLWYYIYIFLTFIHFLIETECEWGRGREQGRHRIRSELQALNWQHRAWHGAQTQGPRDHDMSRSWPLNRLSHPGAPMSTIFLKMVLVVNCTSRLRGDPEVSLLILNYAFHLSHAIQRSISERRNSLSHSGQLTSGIGLYYLSLINGLNFFVIHHIIYVLDILKVLWYCFS